MRHGQVTSFLGPVFPAIKWKYQLLDPRQLRGEFNEAACLTVMNSFPPWIGKQSKPDILCDAVQCMGGVNVLGTYNPSSWAVSSDFKDQFQKDLEKSPLAVLPQLFPSLTSFIFYVLAEVGKIAAKQGLENLFAVMHLASWGKNYIWVFKKTPSPSSWEGGSTRRMLRKGKCSPLLKMSLEAQLRLLAFNSPLAYSLPME